MTKKRLFLILPLLAFATVHKYYVALTEISFNEKQQSVEMIMNVFIDDLEIDLNKTYNIKAQITSPSEEKRIDDYVYQYLQKHFHVKINDKKRQYDFIGKEYDGDLVFFYLEIKNVTDITSIEIKNTMLVNEFEKQQNLIKATVNNERKSLFLNKENDKGLLKF